MGKIGNDLLLFGNRKPWLSLISLMLITFGGLIVGQFVAVLLVSQLYEISLFEVLEMITNISDYPDYKFAIYLLQGLSAVFAFILAPWFFLRFVEKKRISILNPNKQIELIPVILALLISVVFMAANFKFAEWNAQMVLPEFLKGVEDWMRLQEEILEEATIFLTTINNPLEFLTAMLVIAVIPAIGEELLFRGLIQNQIHSWTKNAHLAVWITGILFSAIHVQFYGFVPRMLLGVLFGYMYLWSGNLLYPMLAHFANNGFQIILLYLYGNKMTDFNIDTAETVPWAVFLTAAIVSTVLVLYYKQHFAKNAAETDDWQKVYSTNQIHRAEIVKSVLNDHLMNPVLINKKDSSYHNFGEIEIHVSTEHSMRARQIIENDINFE
jgi:membrane protease YdiL (CAAX protease family)